MAMTECKQCGTEYEAKRATSQYCSSKCKQAAYRNTDAVTVTPVTVTESESVTVTDDGNAPSVMDLPADVVAEIEKMCAENNDGARAASHSRAAMTERALHTLQGHRPCTH